MVRRQICREGVGVQVQQDDTPQVPRAIHVVPGDGVRRDGEAKGMEAGGGLRKADGGRGDHGFASALKTAHESDTAREWSYGPPRQSLTLPGPLTEGY